jgi:hypothetical protein
MANDTLLVYTCMIAISRTLAWSGITQSKIQNLKSKMVLQPGSQHINLDRSNVFVFLNRKVLLQH